MTIVILTELVVDPQTGEVLGFPGEVNPERFTNYLQHAIRTRFWPGWFREACTRCIFLRREP